MHFRPHPYRGDTPKKLQAQQFILPRLFFCLRSVDFPGEIFVIGWGEEVDTMQFTPMDPGTWPRAEMFCYFSRMAPTGYSVTVETDVTALRRTVRDAGVKFFPAYLWLVTKNLNRQTEFRMAEKDGVLGYYDTLTPLYACFHEDDHTFSFMWTAYDDSFPAFFRAYTENAARYGDNRGVLARPEPPPGNAYTVSCLPWVHFTHFAVHSYDGSKPYYFPSVEAGKFREEGGRCMMPLSITCHHAATDGYHIKCFLESLQEDMDRFGRYL